MIRIDDVHWDWDTSLLISKDRYFSLFSNTVIVDEKYIVEMINKCVIDGPNWAVEEAESMQDD